MSATRWLLAGGVLVQACAVGTLESSTPSFDEWVASLHQVRHSGGRVSHFVEGDIALVSDADLQAYYRTRVNRRARFEASDKAGSRSDGLIANSFWTSEEAHELSYCVSDDFGTLKSKVVDAVNAAARNWEAVADVRFHYDPAQDSDCDNYNYDVLFNIRPATASENEDNGGHYDAEAFFPGWWRPWREVIVYKEGSQQNAPSLRSLMSHELGHTLGFAHEQYQGEISNEDPDCHSSGEYISLTPYDVYSIMHYQSCDGKAQTGIHVTPRDATGARNAYGPSKLRQVAFATSSGMFLNVNGINIYTSGTIAKSSTFDTLSLGTGKLAIRTFSRAYLAAENSGGSDVHANRAYLGPWETFSLVAIDSTYFAIRSAGGQYLQVKNGHLQATATYLSQALPLRMVFLDDSPMGARNAAGKYLDGYGGSSWNELWGHALLNRVQLPNGKVALRTRAGAYLSRGAQNAGYSWTLGPSEQFVVASYADGTASFKASDGTYLTALNSDAPTFQTTLGPNGHFHVIGLMGAAMVFTAANGERWVALSGGGREVDAVAGASNATATFRVVALKNGKVALRAPSGDYVSAQNGGGGDVRADRMWIGAWEQFTMIPQSDGSYAFRTADGVHYLCADLNIGGLLVANRKAIGAWERFVAQSVD